jgi:tetratricopeptide (TPR) repeat protein
MPAEVTKLDEIAGDDGWSPLRKHLDVRSFGINAWTVGEVGAHLINEHDELASGHEELYLVVAGRATFTVDGEELDATPGTVVFVRDPASKRMAVAAEAGTTVVVVGAKPGEAYRPLSWEENATVLPLFAAGRYDEAKERLEEALGRYDDRSALLYNLACAEARLGETDQALAHLRESIGGRASLADLARDDEDLAALREDPRFAAVLTPG